MMKSSHHSFVIGETFGSYDNWIRSANRDGFAGDFDLRWVCYLSPGFPSRFTIYKSGKLSTDR
jgi:hypothetical protein